MKKVILSSLSLLILLSVVIFTGCQKDDSNENPAIAVQDNGSLTQNVFADETQGKSGVTFTTTGAWMSSISETTAKKAAATPAWISIDPDHGDKAGNYTISISFEPNYTGADRAATIRIVCDDTEIMVSVTQKSVKEDGKTPIAVSGVTLNQSELSLFAGDKSILEAIIEPADADDKTLVWSSSNPAVAIVSETGEVTAVTEGEAIITVTAQDGGKTASCTVVVKRLPSLNELVTQCNSLFDDAVYTYGQIDDQYSTYTSRLSLTQVTPALWDYWQKSYAAIDACNLLLERVDRESNMSDENKNRYKGSYQGYRASIYFYMSVIFGNIPLVTSVETSWKTLPSATRQEVIDFVRTDLNYAITNSPQEQTGLALPDFFRLMDAKLAMKTGDTQRAVDHLKITVANLPADVSELTFYQAYLLSAEAYLKVGQATEAIIYVNRLLQMQGKQPISQSTEILATVKTIFTSYNEWMKLLNADRWGETASWGYRELLPIPQLALNENSSLTQNPSW